MSDLVISYRVAADRFGPMTAAVVAFINSLALLTVADWEKVATRDAAWDAARYAAWDAARDAAWDAAWNAARDAARDAAWNAARDAARDAARYAACGVAVFDLITAEQFAVLTESFEGLPVVLPSVAAWSEPAEAEATK